MLRMIVMKILNVVNAEEADLCLKLRFDNKSDCCTSRSPFLALFVLQLPLATFFSCFVLINNRNTVS